MSINKAILVGRLGNDPELKTLPSGGSVANFSVATTESWTDKSSGNAQERTEWHRITVYGKLADLCAQFLRKGSEAYIEGSIHTRTYDDKDGTKRSITEIKAQTVQFIGGRREDRQDAPPPPGNSRMGGTPQGAQRGAQGPVTASTFDDSDCPFAFIILAPIAGYLAQFVGM